MILICTALRCEAQAIIESFKLTRSGDLFAGEQMLLYICGVRFGAKFKAGAAGGIEIEFKSEPGAEFICRADTDAEFGRKLRRDRRGAGAKFEHSSDAGALCGVDAETGFAQNAAKNFKISYFSSTKNSERLGEILFSRRVDFALNIGVCGCEDKGVQIGEAFYFDGTAAQEFCGEDGSELYGLQSMGRGVQAQKIQNFRSQTFCGASLDCKLRANLICVNESKILNAAEQTDVENFAAINVCGEINAQAVTQRANDAADTKNFTHDAVWTAARATQNTPCTAKDATRGRANRDIRLYDMESALFVSACECARVPWAMMKIVSDHLRGERLCKSFVYELVKASLPQIRAAIKGKI